MIPEIVRSQKLPKKATQNQGFNIIDSMARKLRAGKSDSHMIRTSSHIDRMPPKINNPQKQSNTTYHDHQN